MAIVTLDSLDLSALLCSRVCHDVISPVGAIVNGLEVLEEDNDPSMREFALDLIRKSAHQASARLQFARLAFGAAGSAGAAIDLGDAETVAKGMFQDDKIALTWSSPRVLMPKNRVKLLLNLVMLPFYIVAIFVAGLGAVLFYAINGWLTGRVYYEQVALRRLSPAKVKAWRRANSGVLWLTSYPGSAANPWTYSTA